MSWTKPTSEPPYCCNQKAVWIDYGRWLCYWYCLKCKKEVGSRPSGASDDNYQAVLDALAGWSIF